MFAINVACQHMHSPMVSQFQAVKYILCYVKGTLKYMLNYTPGPITLYAYSGSDWAGDHSECRSTNGVCMYFGRNPTMWTSIK